MLAGQDADYDIPPHLKQLQSNERCQLITLTDSRRWAMLAGQMLIMASLRTSNSYRAMRGADFLLANCTAGLRYCCR